MTLGSLVSSHRAPRFEEYDIFGNCLAMKLIFLSFQVCCSSLIRTHLDSIGSILVSSGSSCWNVRFDYKFVEIKVRMVINWILKVYNSNMTGDARSRWFLLMNQVFFYSTNKTEEKYQTNNIHWYWGETESNPNQAKANILGKTHRCSIFEQQQKIRNTDSPPFTIFTPNLFKINSFNSPFLRNIEVVLLPRPRIGHYQSTGEISRRPRDLLRRDRGCLQNRQDTVGCSGADDVGGEYGQPSARHGCWIKSSFHPALKEQSKP